MNDCCYEWRNNLNAITPISNTCGHHTFSLNVVVIQPGKTREGILREKQKVDHWEHTQPKEYCLSISLIKMITTAPMTKNASYRTHTWATTGWKESGLRVATRSPWDAQISMCYLQSGNRAWIMLSASPWFQKLICLWRRLCCIIWQQNFLSVLNEGMVFAESYLKL